MYGNELYVSDGAAGILRGRILAVTARVASPHTAFPDYLYDKGFRWYCGTDSSQWFNILFTSDDPVEATRPKSGTASLPTRRPAC